MVDQAQRDDDELEELVMRCLEASDPQAELERRTVDQPQLRDTARHLLQQVAALQRLEPAPVASGDPDPEDRATWPAIPDVELDAMVGRGGQGFVFRGRQTYLDRTVAVKVLAAEWRTPTFLERFRREARMLAGLQHPHIVTCHQAGLSDDGECFLVMEFIDGPTLRTFSQQHGKMPLAAALRMTADLATALEYANDLGLVHRDVKPENVLLQPKAATAGDPFPFVPKLADLGLARPVQRGQQFTMLTPVGAVIGTPVTMAPEQFDAPEHVDHRADIYGLGCILHQALAGRPPFHGTAMTKLLEQKAAMRGPGSRVSIPGMPAPVLQLIARMLAYDAAQRPQTYRALIAELEALMPDAAQRAPVRGRLRWALAGTVVIAAAVFAAWPDAIDPRPLVAARSTVTEGETVTIRGALRGGADGTAAGAWRLQQTNGAQVRTRQTATGQFEFTVPHGTADSDLGFRLGAGDDPAAQREVRMHIQPDPATVPLLPGVERPLFGQGDNVMALWACDPTRWGVGDVENSACANSQRDRTEASLVLPRGGFELRGHIVPRFRYEAPPAPPTRIADTGCRVLFADDDALALRIGPASASDRFLATLGHEQRDADGRWNPVAQLAALEGAWTIDDPLQFVLRWNDGEAHCAFGASSSPDARDVEVRPAAEWRLPWTPASLVLHADRGVAVFTDWVLAARRQK